MKKKLEFKIKTFAESFTINILRGLALTIPLQKKVTTQNL